MSQSAFERLSPAFPQRAPWGTSARLRAWQAEALRRYLETSPRDFLAVATPGAGKTTFALRVAAELLHARIVRKVIVVAPTEHLKVQWADAAAKVGIQLDPGLGGSRKGRIQAVRRGGRHLRGGGRRDVHLRGHGRPRTDPGDPRRGAPRRRRAQLGRRRPRGVSARHAPAGADRHAVSQRPEPDPVRHLRRTARRRKGQPCRLHLRLRRGAARPRRPSGGVHELRRADAVAHQVRRDVRRQPRRGTDQGRHRPGLAHRPRPEGRVDLGGARCGRPATDRGAPARPGRRGLVIASNQAHARAYARVLASVSGEQPTLVLSDDAGSSKRIEAFAEGDSRWMVAVRMVSEGVDVPRLAVGVYATATRPRCSSPRRSDGSSGRGGAARSRRCSCRRCRSSWRTRPPWSGSATTCSAAPAAKDRSGTSPRPCWTRPTGARRRPTSWREASRR